jgi:hypothetical protein
MAELKTLNLAWAVKQIEEARAASEARLNARASEVIAALTDGVKSTYIENPFEYALAVWTKEFHVSGRNIYQGGQEHPGTTEAFDATLRIGDAVVSLIGTGEQRLLEVGRQKRFRAYLLLVEVPE